MATPDIYNISTPQSNMNNSGPPKSDICYLPSAPMPPGPSPPLYPMPAAPLPPPPPPPYAVLPPMQQSIYVPPPQAAPVLLTHVQVPYQGVVIAGNFLPSQTAHINDYMIWSIINVFLGGIFLGLIVLLLSSQTRKRKIEGDVAGATSMSKITLACNIIITLLFCALTAFIIIYYTTTLTALTTYY